MLELFVGASLAGLAESQSLKQCDDLARLEDRRLHESADSNRLQADKLGLELGGAVLKEQRDDLAEVLLQLVQRLGLAMGAGKAGHIAYVKLRIGVPLDDRSICGHGMNDTSWTSIVPAAT